MPLSLTAFKVVKRALAASMLLVSAASQAEQWPRQPMPTTSAEVDAYAKAVKIRPSLKECLGNSEDATPAMRDCLDAEHVYQDKRLNLAYRKLMANLSADERPALRAEERRWITFRDKFCATTPEPGQGQELDALSCLVNQTADRATELESKLAAK